MRACLVFNPKAGTAHRIKDFLMHISGENRWELRIVPDEDALKALGDDLKRGDFDRVVLGGGDGTVSAVVRALGPEFPPIDIALLPFGTGNDLARSLGIDREDIATAFDLAVNGRSVPVDVVRMETAHETSWFVNVANGGFGGCIASDIDPQDKKRWGQLAYWMASASAVVRPEAFEVQLRLDDNETIDDRVLGVAIANGRFAGAGFPVAPGAYLDDGQLVVTTVPELPAVELIAAGADYVLGREGDSQRVRTRKARSVTVTSVPDMAYSIDGEATREFAVHFEVEPGALKFVPGAEPGALCSSSAATTEGKR